MDVWPVSKEYQEGYDAYHAGLAVTDNPYPLADFPSDHAEWYLGFMDAEDGD